MANNVARSKKPVLKTIHTWIGIVSGLFLSVIALTGSVILFRAEFERAAFPPTAAADGSLHVSIDQAAREVGHLRPGYHVRRVRIPAGPSDPYIFQIQSSGKRTERIVSDASSGRVLGALQPGWVDWMVDLHRNLLSGPTGRSVVGGFGIVLFVLSATGLLMWLTGARNWRAWVLRRGGSATRFNYHLHRTSGLWAYAFLGLISFTGIELAYPNTFRDAVQSLTGKPATVGGPRGGVKADAILPLEEFVRIGREAMPDGVPVELRLAEPGKGPVDLRLHRSGDLAPSGNHVYLDPASGAVLMIDRVVDRPIGARFLAAMSPIHYGQFGGTPIKIAWLLLGLTPVLLFVTGLIAWWRPTKSKSNPAVPKETEVLVG